MRLTLSCHKKVLGTALGIFIFSASLTAQAVTLNFAAHIMDTTCEVSLDKSVLSLGNVTVDQLKPGALLNPQSFVVTLSQCAHNTMESNKQYGFLIVGQGINPDGKWLFRTVGPGAANGVGVMVAQSGNKPSYSDSELRFGTFIDVAPVGQSPQNQDIPFYAALSCGGVTGCASAGTGSVNATFIFILVSR